MFELNELPYQNVSIENFDELFSHLGGSSEQLSFITNYLLSYGANGQEPNCSYNELLHHARTRFAESIAHKQDTYADEVGVNVKPTNINPFNYNIDDIGMQQAFLGNPVRFIQGMAQMINENYPLKQNTREEKETMKVWKRQLQQIDEMSEGKEREFADYVRNAQAKDVQAKISERQRGNKTTNCNDILARHKGGFFERLFRTTSNEYQNFEAAYKVFNDPDSVAYGDLDNLEGSVRNYLKHKIPNFKDTDPLPKPEDIANLSGTSKDRTEFCVDILRSIHEQRHINDINHSFEAMSREQHQNDLEQSSFQEQLSYDIEANSVGNNINIDLDNDNDNEIDNEIDNE